jgi:hypothetical protein
LSEGLGFTAFPRVQHFDTVLLLEDGLSRTCLTECGPYEDRDRCLVQLVGYRSDLCHGWMAKRLLYGQFRCPCGVALAVLSACQGEPKFSKGAVFREVQTSVAKQQV